MSDHEDKKRPDQRIDPFLMLSIGNEVRKEIERATEKIGNKIDSVRSELKDDVKRLEDKIDKRLLKVEARNSYILGLLSVIGVVGGILIFLLRAGGG